MTTTISTARDVHEGRITGLIAEQLLAHLHDEETVLAAMLQAVREVHGALRQLNDEALRQSLDNESQAIQAAEVLQQHRRQLRSQLADALGVPAAEATLGRVISMTTGSLRETVERSRQSLAEMSSELDRLNRQNAAMIRQSLSIAQGIVGRLTRTAAVGESYNADGGRNEAHVGSLVQWGG